MACQSASELLSTALDKSHKLQQTTNYKNNLISDPVLCLFLHQVAQSPVRNRLQTSAGGR